MGIVEWKVAQPVDKKSKTTDFTYSMYGKQESLINQKNLIEQLGFEVDWTVILP